MVNVHLYLLTGEHHRKKQMFCQDSVLAAQINEDIVVAAVSDGCSNARFSDTGAKICVRAFVDTFLSMPQESIKKFCISKEGDKKLKDIVIRTIHNTIQKTDLDHSLLSSTLLGVLCHKNKAVLVHIGDGFAARFKRCGHIDIVSQPENGTTQNITFFATSPSAAEHIRVTHIRKFDKILISTDGLSKGLGKKIPKNFFEPQKLQEFLIENQSNLVDDCSAILICSQKNKF